MIKEFEIFYKFRINSRELKLLDVQLLHEWDSHGIVKGEVPAAAGALLVAHRLDFLYFVVVDVLDVLKARTRHGHLQRILLRADILGQTVLGALVELGAQRLQAANGQWFYKD